MARPSRRSTRPSAESSAERRAQRERMHGIDPDDEAGRWLAENEAKPPPRASKSAFKSKALHRWRQRKDST